MTASVFHRATILMSFVLALRSVDGRQLSGTLMVANRASSVGISVDLPTHQFLDKFPTGLAPHQAIPVSANSTEFLFTDYGSRPSTLTVGDVRTGSVRTISLDPYLTPHDLEVLDGESCIVTVQDSDALVIVHIQSGQITQVIDTPNVQCHMVSVNPANPSLAACADFFSGTVGIIDLVAGQMISSFYSGNAAIGVKFHPFRDELWVTNRDENTISIIDTTTLDIVARLVPPGISRPIRVVFTDDGQHALVINEFSGDISVFDVGSRTEVRRIVLQASRRGAPTEIGIVEGGFALVADNVNNAVHILDLTLFEVVDVIFGFDNPEGVGFTEVKIT